MTPPHPSSEVGPVYTQLAHEELHDIINTRLTTVSQIGHMPLLVKLALLSLMASLQCYLLLPNGAKFLKNKTQLREISFFILLRLI